MNTEPVIPISAIEHFEYCPRQCALILCDGVWNDNVHTVKGVRAHRRVDSGGIAANEGGRCFGPFRSGPRYWGCQAAPMRLKWKGERSVLSNTSRASVMERPQTFNCARRRCVSKKCLMSRYRTAMCGMADQDAGFGLISRQHCARRCETSSSRSGSRC